MKTTFKIADSVYDKYLELFGRLEPAGDNIPSADEINNVLIRDEIDFNVILYLMYLSETGNFVTEKQKESRRAILLYLEKNLEFISDEEFRESHVKTGFIQNVLRIKKDSAGS